MGAMFPFHSRPADWQALLANPAKQWRAASAVLAGEQYRAAAAMLLVHSFSRRQAGWEDFAAFCRLFGTTPEAGRVERLEGEQAVPLFAVWVPGDQRFLVA